MTSAVELHPDASFDFLCMGFALRHVARRRVAARKTCCGRFSEYRGAVA
jgi:ubiquinone/menaquinone biosynthesis C-methylase UbiE